MTKKFFICSILMLVLSIQYLHSSVFGEENIPLTAIQFNTATTKVEATKTAANTANLLTKMTNSIDWLNKQYNKLDSLSQMSKAGADINKFAKRAMQTYNTMIWLKELTLAVERLICIVQDFEMDVSQYDYMFGGCIMEFLYQRVVVDLSHVNAVIRGLTDITDLLSPVDKDRLGSSLMESINQVVDNVNEIQHRINSNLQEEYNQQFEMQMSNSTLVVLF